MAFSTATAGSSERRAASIERLFWFALRASHMALLIMLAYIPTSMAHGALSCRLAIRYSPIPGDPLCGRGTLITEAVLMRRHWFKLTRRNRGAIDPKTTLKELARPLDRFRDFIANWIKPVARRWAASKPRAKRKSAARSGDRVAYYSRLRRPAASNPLKCLQSDGSFSSTIRQAETAFAKRRRESGCFPMRLHQAGRTD